MDRLTKILSLLGIDKLEESDKKEVHKVFDSIITDQVNERFENDEEKTKKLCENILNHIDQKTDEMFEADSTINLFSVVNSAKNLTGDSAKLAGLIIGLLAYISNESKYLSIAKSLTSSTSSTNENDELYLYKKVQGLTSKQQSYMLQVLEGCTIEEIDKKFDLLLKESTKGDEPTYQCICPNCGKKTDSKKACNLVKCDECNETLKSSTNEGTGFSELEKVNEDSNPFKDDLQQYRNVWNTN